MKAVGKVLAVSCLITACRSVDQQIGGDNYCIASECAGYVLTVPSVPFSLTVSNNGGCNGTKLVVETGSTMLSNGIDCDGRDFACMESEIEVYNSDLTTNGALIDCRPSSGNIDDCCTDMMITLIDSQVDIVCGFGDCNGLEVHLYGASHFTVDGGSDPNSCNTEAGTLYYYSSSATYDVSTITNFVVFELSTPPPTTSTTAVPSTTTTFIFPSTTTEEPTTTDLWSTTAPVTTEVTTTSVPLFESTSTTEEIEPTEATPTILPTTTESEDDDESLMDKLKKYKYFGAVAIGILLTYCCIWSVGRRRRKKTERRQRELAQAVSDTKAVEMQ